MDWFRFYTKTLESQKVQALSPVLFKAWVNLLAVCRIFDGCIPPDEAAFRLRTTRKQIDLWIGELVSRNLIDPLSDGTFVAHDWDEHQCVSDDSAPRSRLRRQRIRDTGVSINGYVKHRKAVYERDGYRCVYCGSHENLCIDHMVPVVKGGTDDISNLATSCKGCNSGKSGRTPDEAGFSFKSVTAMQLYESYVQRLHKQKCNGLDQIRADTEQSRADTEACASVRVEPNPSTNGTRLNWQGDEGYQSLKSAYEEAGACPGGVTLTEADWATGFFPWRQLDFDQKLAAVQGIRDRQSAGTEGKYYQKPERYLQGGYKSEVRARAPEKQQASLNEKVRIPGGRLGA